MMLELLGTGANKAARAVQHLVAVSGRLETARAVLLRGCWHSKMGWPIRLDGYTYRVCLGCGIKRLFDEGALACYGGYGYDVEQLAAEWALHRERESIRGLVSALAEQEKR